MAAPKNVEYYVSRINGYSKNTIRLQPVSNKATGFVAGDVVIFRLPTNAIVDLHTLALAFENKVTITANVATGTTFDTPQVAVPRYAQSLIRRLDVTAGGVQVGLGSLQDYGGLWSLLSVNSISTTKHNELSILEGASDVSFTTQTDGYGLQATSAIGDATAVTGNIAVGSSYYWSCPSISTVVGSPVTTAGTAKVTDTYSKYNITGFLGVLGGQYMRFLDTNLLPDVEIRITLASNNVFAPLGMTAGSVTWSYAWLDPVIQVETISFGDSTYEQMVEARLSTGEPIVVPFINHASFETSTGASAKQGQTQFTVATQSLNAVMGTARLGNYDQVSGVVDPKRCITTPYYSFDAETAAKTTPVPTITTGSADGTKHGSGVVKQFATLLPGRYQLTIDSKVYPQFQADLADCYQLTKNMFDGAGNNKMFAGLAGDLYGWSHSGFMLGISLDHNSDTALADRLVSGLNTNGSNIPITWQMTSAWGASEGFRPTVFVEMTSTLMLYPGRVISVIN